MGSKLQLRWRYLIFHSVNLLQIDPNRTLAGLVDGDIADPVGGQVGVAILVIGDFVLPRDGQA